MRDPVVASARIIWLAILLSVMLFYVALRFAQRPSAPADPSLFPIFAAVALGLAVASFVVPAHLRQAQAKNFVLETREAPGVVTPDSPNATKRVFADPEKALKVARQLFQTHLVLSLALSEAVALFGFVLGYQGFPDDRILPFFVTAIALIVLRYPAENGPQKCLEKSHGASFP